MSDSPPMLRVRRRLPSMRSIVSPLVPPCRLVNASWVIACPGIVYGTLSATVALHPHRVVRASGPTLKASH
eukprot:6471351-Amphidinium_carterae.1